MSTSAVPSVFVSNRPPRSMKTRMESCRSAFQWASSGKVENNGASDQASSVQLCSLNVRRNERNSSLGRAHPRSYLPPYVWPGSPLLRRKRDQAELLHSGASTDPELRAELECRAHRSAPHRSL